MYIHVLQSKFERPESTAFRRPAWCAERERHCVQDASVPYNGKAWGWVCADPEWLDEPRLVKRKTGAQIFQKL